MDLDGRVMTLNKRYAAVKEAGTRIQAMVAVRAPGARGGGRSARRRRRCGLKLLTGILETCSTTAGHPTRGL